ncbi:MAG: LpxI family protein [Candidatus Brocadiia bacterium]
MNDEDTDRQEVRECRIGLLAGSGRFPVCFARGARCHGHSVVAIGLKGQTSPELEDVVDEMHWTGLAKLGKWITIFREAGVSRAVMCGGVPKEKIYDNPLNLVPDWRSARFLYSRRGQWEDHFLLGELAEEFEKEGIHIENSVIFCPELLAPAGVLTTREPDEREWEDVRFAWPRIKQIAALQIGQTIVVKDGAVVAVEGMDGTDATLRRAGEIAGEGTVAVKVAREDHDPRFDIPCVGTATIGVLDEAGVSTLAMEAGNTLLLDRAETVARAEECGVSLVSVTEEDVRGGEQ